MINKVDRLTMAYKMGQTGGSILGDQEKANTRPAFPGEMHPWSTESGARYNYLGPKTQVVKRAFDRNDPPINDLDAAAKKHDVGYVQNANALKAGQITKGEFLGNVKKLDFDFKESAKQSKDAPYLGKLSAVAIGAKEVAEDLFLPTSAFSGGSLKQMQKRENEKKKDPAERLKKLVKAGTLDKNNNIVINVSSELKKEQQYIPEIEGGFIPLAVVGASILSGLAGTALDKLITYFSNSQTMKGNGGRMTKYQKVQFLINNVQEQDLLKGINDVLAIK